MIYDKMIKNLRNQTGKQKQNLLMPVELLTIFA